jgi:hypothetical protein
MPPTPLSIFIFLGMKQKVILMIKNIHNLTFPILKFTN